MSSNLNPSNFLKIISIPLISKKIEGLGSFLLFVRSTVRQMFSKPFRPSLILQQLEFIGNQSLNIILLAGFFTGAVFGLQLGGIFKVFKAESLMGGATAIALATELAPLVAGFLLAGRAGSAMTAEISTMKVNEQIDAMEAMGVDPVNYLVVPRVFASLIMMPLLCGLFMFIGIVGAYISGILIYEIDQGIFVEKLVQITKPENVITGLRKMFVFSFLISTISCKFGLESSGGAKGVGDSTTNAVVNTLVWILLFDLVISFIEIRWLS